MLLIHAMWATQINPHARLVPKSFCLRWDLCKMYSQLEGSFLASHLGTDGAAWLTPPLLLKGHLSLLNGLVASTLQGSARVALAIELSLWSMKWLQWLSWQCIGSSCFFHSSFRQGRQTISTPLSSNILNLVWEIFKYQGRKREQMESTKTINW